MILVIDNYDSFTYNLVQQMGEMGAELHIARNDQITLDVAWKAPYYRVHVGRFANRAEGERALQAVVSEFPGAFLVPTRVTVTR